MINKRFIVPVFKKINKTFIVLKKINKTFIDWHLDIYKKCTCIYNIQKHKTQQYDINNHNFSLNKNFFKMPAVSLSL